MSAALVNPVVFGAVLAGAFLHAGWNANVKARSETVFMTMAVATAAAVIAALLLPSLASPVPASWSAGHVSLPRLRSTSHLREALLHYGRWNRSPKRF
ncbi:hypothetical protein [Massilia sp. PWRC2]|uniref:hypothetical protein n=1 Tax=Massilia sp. PWRC2 TaxID=2804626 RepID=UPI003CED81A2